MGPAPIPPHERSWRHPSELGPTAPAHVGPERPGSRWTLAIATGAVAVAVIAVFTITTAPGRTPGPVAMSATTLPAYTVSPTEGSSSDAQAPAAASDANDTMFGSVRLAQPLLSTSSGLALTGAPKTVAAPVPLDASPGQSDARGLPDTATPVHIITESHIYRVAFGDLERVLAPDGSIVVDSNGMLLGTFDDGRFVDG